MCRRLGNDVDLIEREALGIFALLRDDVGPHSLKSGNLPVDVQHLRLEERRAIKRDDRLRIRGIAQCLESNTERQNQKLIVKSLIPFHFPVSGSSTTLSSALPYWGGAFGFNI